MRPSKYLSVFVLPFVVATAVAVRAQTPAPQTPTVDEVVAMNLKARGGVDLLRATESMKMSGTVSSPAGQAKLTVWMKRPNRKRTETEFGGQKAVEAFDGTTWWRALGEMPPQTLPQGPQLEEARRQSALDPLLLDYQERGRKVELVGREKVDGADAFHLRIIEKGHVTHYYVNATTGLDQKMVNRVVSPEGLGSAQMELRFSEYRDTQGRMVPFTIQQVVDGKAVAQTKLESVEFNIPIDDAMFRMPARAPRVP